MKKKIFIYLVLLLILYPEAGTSCKRKQQQTTLQPSTGVYTQGAPSTSRGAALSSRTASRPGLSRIPLLQSGIKPTPVTDTTGNQGNQIPRIMQLNEPDTLAKKILLDKTGNNYPFLAEKTAALFPVDYKIGPLQELTGIDKEQQTIISNLTAFLNGLIKGNIEKQWLNKENSADLQSFLNYNLKKKSNIPTKYKIGKIGIKKGNAQANLRLYSEKGVTEGEIFMILNDNAWYISDLQINLDILGTEYQQTKEKFIPTSYYWILKNK